MDELCCALRMNVIAEKANTRISENTFFIRRKFYMNGKV
jgi:hypothetical protein